MYVISHSKATLLSYRTGIRRLRDFLRDNYQFDELKLAYLVKNNEIEICKFLKDFVIYLDQSGLKARTIKLTMSVTKSYLRNIGIKIDSDDLKLVVKLPKIIKTREIPLDKGIILRLLRNAKPKLQLAIMMAISTGSRITELASIKISDVCFDSTPTLVNVRAETTKTRQSRECFLTTEATNALKDYIKRFHSWDENTKDPTILEKHIFGTIFRDTGRFVAESAVQMLQVALMELVRSLPDLDVKNENGRASVHFHAFRKYFRTTVGNAVGRDYAEALMGHGFYLDTYYQLTEEKKREMFLQAESYLTISDFQTVEKNLKLTNEKFQNLEIKFDNLMNYLEKNSIHIPTVY